MAVGDIEDADSSCLSNTTVSVQGEEFVMEFYSGLESAQLLTIPNYQIG